MKIDCFRRGYLKYIKFWIKYSLRPENPQYMIWWPRPFQFAHLSVITRLGQIASMQIQKKVVSLFVLGKHGLCDCLKSQSEVMWTSLDVVAFRCTSRARIYTLVRPSLAVTNKSITTVPLLLAVPTPMVLRTRKLSFNQ